jgi:hypothetical protein
MQASRDFDLARNLASQSEASLRQASLSLTGLSCSELLAQFQSLGRDCEFGLVQRQCGAEPLGLFRFSNPSPELILRLVKTNFDGFGDNSTVELDQQRPRREWIVVDKANGLREHTFIREGDRDEAVIRAHQKKRTYFLRQLMISSIAEGDKIFVIKAGRGVLTQELAIAISEALRERGPNWLLWADQGTDVGRIDVLADGLLRGIVDIKAKLPDAPRSSTASWLAVLIGAWRIIRMECGDAYWAP